MSILFYCNWPNKSEWINALRKKFRRKKIQIWPKITNADEIRYAIVWNIRHGELKKLKNLEVIFSLGAGVDHLLNDPKIPRIPIVRLKDPIMRKRMSNYIQSQIFNYQLNNYQYYENKKKSYWKEAFSVLDNNDLTIGILGIGYLGSYTAKKLYKNGYKVQGFKNKKYTNKILFPIYHHKKNLNKFISTSDIIINFLPDTVYTKDFINKKFLKYMKRKSLLINVGRGSTVNEIDLNKHAKKNKEFKAVLDVFKKEPLSKKHPFWKQKNIVITPHVASITNIESAVEQIYNVYSVYKKTGRTTNTVNYLKQY